MAGSDSGDPRDRLTFGQFVGIYFAVLLVCVVPGYVLYPFTGIEPARVGLVSFGVAFLLAAWGKPWWWSATIRRAGWFSALPNSFLTWLLVILAIFIILVGSVAELPRDVLLHPE